mmetsp:Transcript_8916/g.20810  ORF Transcript_8916/g.20810 Transcript_8916/m.20810 type:complete len:89 (-) Transcript_8916:8-274(-)
MPTKEPLKTWEWVFLACFWIPAIWFICVFDWEITNKPWFPYFIYTFEWLYGHLTMVCGFLFAVATLMNSGELLGLFTEGGGKKKAGKR